MRDMRVVLYLDVKRNGSVVLPHDGHEREAVPHVHVSVFDC